MQRTTRATTRRRLGVGIAAAALALTACSGDDPADDESGDAAGESSEATETPSEAEQFADSSPAEILEAALAAMRETGALRFAGTITTDGEKLTIDVRVAPSGDCTGTVGQGGGSSQFIQVGKRGWIRPDAAFWRTIAGPQADAIIQRVGDMWVTVPDDGGAFDDICEIDSLLDELEEDPGEVTVGDLGRVAGRPAVPLELTSGDDPGTVWVAAEEPHHILRVESTSSDEPGRLTFSDFDADLKVKPPPKTQVADLG